MLRAIPAVMKRLDPNLPVEELKTMPQQVQGERVPRPDDQHAVRGVRAAGDAARGRRAVRRARVLGRAAHARDRRAHGARRRARDVRAMVLRQVGVMTLDRRAIGDRRRLWAWQAARVAALRAGGARSGRDRRRAVVLALVALAAGYMPAIARRGGSDAGVAVRVGIPSTTLLPIAG